MGIGEPKCANYIFARRLGPYVACLFLERDSSASFAGTQAGSLGGHMKGKTT